MSNPILEDADDPTMLFLGRPLTRFSGDQGWFGAGANAAVQVRIERHGLGWTAHGWVYDAGNGKTIQIFGKRKRAKTPEEALERLNATFRRLRNAMKEADEVTELAAVKP